MYNVTVQVTVTLNFAIMLDSKYHSVKNEFCSGYRPSSLFRAGGSGK